MELQVTKKMITLLSQCHRVIWGVPCTSLEYTTDKDDNVIPLVYTTVMQGKKTKTMQMPFPGVRQCTSIHHGFELGTYDVLGIPG